jgi:hypothetical protein
LGQIEKIVQEQTRWARSFQHAVHAVEVAARDLPAEIDRSEGEAHTLVAALSRSAQEIKTASNERSVDFKVAWHDYQARRYKAEGEFNRHAAEMYEIQVRKSSALSERHRDRSKDFFFGMLAAQAGVTIATLSLAVKHKSVLWALASLTGLAAVLFAVYVHVYM